jgi:hypothetical protein
MASTPPAGGAGGSGGSGNGDIIGQFRQLNREFLQDTVAMTEEGNRKAIINKIQ